MGVRLGLGAIDRVDRALGRPAADLPVVHLVGTNGKGSTAAMVELGLRRLGGRTGLYTSPHLERVGERVRVDGVPVADERIRLAAEEVARAEAQTGEVLSFFEVLTLVALRVFDGAGLDVVVLEAGLGGRLDATRIRPAVHTLVTRVGLDHQRFLGSRHVDVAREKAAVMRTGVPVASQLQRGDVAEVLRAQARRVGAPLQFVMPTERAPLGLDGSHQRHNAALALHALRRWSASADLELVDGVRWPGRVERLAVGAGQVILDAAHNLEGVEALVATLAGAEVDVIAFTCQEDKPGLAMLDALGRLPRGGSDGAPVRIWASLEAGACPASGWPDAILPMPAAGSFTGADAQAASSVDDAVLTRARAGETVLVCGSHLLVGAVRARMRAEGLLGEGDQPAASGAVSREWALSDPRKPAESVAHLEPDRDPR